MNLPVRIKVRSQGSEEFFDGLNHTAVSVELDLPAPVLSSTRPFLYIPLNVPRCNVMS